jgi:hypothetical protein
MINPMYEKMLKEFVNHIERRDSKSGWQIISKVSYETTNFRKRSSKHRPPNSQRQTMKIFAEWMEMGEKDLEFEIETFLRDWNEK